MSVTDPSINNGLYHGFAYSAASWHKYEYPFDLSWGNETFDGYDSHKVDGAAIRQYSLAEYAMQSTSRQGSDLFFHNCP